MCPPELYLLKRVMKGEIADATFIIQAYIAEGLRSRGHRLSFLGSYYSEGPVYSGELDALEPVRLAWTGSTLFEITRKVVWQIQRLIGIPYLNFFSNLRLMDACMQILPGNDLVYERNTMYRFGVAKACKRLGIPYVLYFEADDILEHDIMKKPITGLLRWRAGRAIRTNLDAADRVICVSEPLKKHLVKKWDVPAEKIVVFPNVADVRRFKPDPGARYQVRESFGISAAPLILFVGNFYEWHDVGTLLKAFVEVLKNFPDARVMLVGDGAKRRAMEQLARELGIEQAVIFTGMVAHTDVPRYMAAADIAVVPYPLLDQDIWLSPLKLFEYMAAGNPIIASDVGQLSEWIDDGRNGLLVPPGDVTAMAAAIDRLIRNPDLPSRLGRSAREDAVEKHSWDRYLSDLDDLYYSVLTEGKRS
jgi:glycosyltransferase involved in cell wall biosynthesis